MSLVAKAAALRAELSLPATMPAAQAIVAAGDVKCCYILMKPPKPQGAWES